MSGKLAVAAAVEVRRMVESACRLDVLVVLLVLLLVD